MIFLPNAQGKGEESTTKSGEATTSAVHSEDKDKVTVSGVAVIDSWGHCTSLANTQTGATFESGKGCQRQSSDKHSHTSVGAGGEGERDKERYRDHEGCGGRDYFGFLLVERGLAAEDADAEERGLRASKHTISSCASMLAAGVSGKGAGKDIISRTSNQSFATSSPTLMPKKMSIAQVPSLVLPPADTIARDCNAGGAEIAMQEEPAVPEQKDEQKSPIHCNTARKRESRAEVKTG